MESRLGYKADISYVEDRISDLDIRFSEKADISYVDNELNSRLTPIPPVDVTIPPAGWEWEGDEAPYTITIMVGGLVENGLLLPAQGASAEERRATRAALLSVAGQDAWAESISLVADGVLPEIPLPMTFIPRGLS